jgi:NitT/TauT family transport system ATP-binding protein
MSNAADNLTTPLNSQRTGAMPDSKSKIHIAGVSHSFAERETDGADLQSLILDNVSLDMHNGEFVSIIGPSGCGKTTLLNLIAGFLDQQSGTVKIDDVTVEGIQAGKVAYMFANDTLYPWRTALDNVTFPFECGRGARLRNGISHHECARQLLDSLGLGQAAAKYPQELSHGMRQRVALARTIACDADILLMDEPFGALDAQTRVLVQAEFAQIWERYAKTVVMVTHDLTEAITLSDRIVVMSHRPSRIKKLYDVNIPRPRNVLDLPTTAAFHELYASLWNDLRPELTSEAA